MLRRTTGAATFACLVAACTGLQRDPDPTPINPTAVLELAQSSTGLLDAPAFEGSTIAWSRANMQRSETRTRGGGTITQFLNVDAGARIERLDRKLTWTLDAKNKVAAECPLKGCAVPSPKKSPATRPADTARPRDTECRMKAGNTSVSLEPTGQKRTLNGFEVEQYDVKWIVTFRDNAARKSTSTASLDVWTTPQTAALRDAAAIEKAFYRGRDRALGIDTEAERAGLLPADAGRMISSYLAPNVSPTDRANFLAGARKIDKVPGVPILVTLKWTFAGDACATNEAAKDGSDKPLFTYTAEVKSHRVEPKHDSLFAPPRDYKITK